MPNPLSPQQIDAMRILLEDRKQELESQLTRGNAATQPVTLDQQSVGRVSRIDAIQQQQMAIANQEQAHQLLKQIELALNRIKSGEYGFCLHCQEPIALARLQAQPSAGLCLNCQSSSEGA